MHLEDRIFSVRTADEFEQLALDIFEFQYANVPVYRDYVDQLGHKRPTNIQEIPFLPISFFKSHRVCVDQKETLIFKSSGTGGARSTHYLVKPELYQKSFNATYDALIGRPVDQVILALLPNYLEQGESSLVYMVDHLIQRTENTLSGFVLNDYNELIDRYKRAVDQHKQVIIFGVSYALLDLTELNPDLEKAIIIETGGMKGRRKELTKTELHQQLKAGLRCNQIWSEYGMTEMLSQAYSHGDEFYTCGSTMKILIREMNDPFSYATNGKTGGINVIDLSNLYSCSFIETQDLGAIHENGFKLMGRFDTADLRGCNLMVS